MRRAFEIILVVAAAGILLMLASTQAPENRYDLGVRDGRKCFKLLGKDNDPDTVFMSLALYGAFHGEQRRRGYADGYIMASEEHFRNWIKDQISRKD